VWDWLDYGALIAATIVVLSALANFAVQILLGLRSLKRLRRQTAKELASLAERIDAAAERAERAGRTPELEARLAHLRRSLARLAVLRAAFAEATSFTAFIPRK
jgi:hypothetical protein